jgi:hypothetical protein
MNYDMYLYIFYLDDAADPVRIPLAKWQRLSKGRGGMAELAGKTVKVLFAYIEVQDGRPFFCPRVDGVICRFDREGVLLQPECPPVDLLYDLYCRSEPVADLTRRIEQQEYFKRNCWEIDRTSLKKILDAIWP